MTAEQVRRELIRLAEPDYQKFHANLSPGIGGILGVRVPKLRKLAQEVAKDDWRRYLQETEYTDIYEELMIQGMCIGYAEMDLETRAKMLDFFVPYINSWGVCDCCASTYKFVNKNLDFWYQYLQKWLQSNKEYELRFAAVMLLDYYIREEWIENVLKIYNTIHHDGYYVKMAVAWGISICYIKFPKQTLELLKQNQLDDFTHNKSIQKICESYRVTKEDKEMLRNLKR